MPGEPWKVAEVAAFLRVHPKTVRKLGVPQIPVVVEPGRRPLTRYDADEVRAWWAERVNAARRARDQQPLVRTAPRLLAGRRVLDRAAQAGGN